MRTIEMTCDQCDRVHTVEFGESFECECGNPISAPDFSDYTDTFMIYGTYNCATCYDWGWGGEGCPECGLVNSPCPSEREDECPQCHDMGASPECCHCGKSVRRLSTDEE